MATSMRLILLQFSRLTISRVQHTPLQRCFQTFTGPLNFQATNVLQSEVMKKKKNVMSAQDIQLRDKRSRKKIEKAISKLKAKGRTFKPVIEIEGDRAVEKTKDDRIRTVAPLTFEESERRALLQKQWTRYKWVQWREEQKQLRRVLESQQNALQELRAESEELYLQAVQFDETLLPFERNGPLNTPPIKDYPGLDGEYTDTTPKYDK